MHLNCFQSTRVHIIFVSFTSIEFSSLELTSITSPVRRMTSIKLYYPSLSPMIPEDSNLSAALVTKKISFFNKLIHKLILLHFWPSLGQNLQTFFQNAFRIIFKRFLGCRCFASVCMRNDSSLRRSADHSSGVSDARGARLRSPRRSFR